MWQRCSIHLKAIDYFVSLFALLAKYRDHRLRYAAAFFTYLVYRCLLIIATRGHRTESHHIEIPGSGAYCLLTITRVPIDWRDERPGGTMFKVIENDCQ